MQQYLINTTAIWLLSLLLFDIFLRRESYHSYNRFYLLFTLILGSTLPLVQWPQASAVYPTVLHAPVERVIAARQTIAAAAIPSQEINWAMWLAAIYIMGAVAALSVLVADALKLAASFRSGKRSVSGRWQLIETGKEHAPFSFRNTLFVQSRQQYSTDEWNMILTHEQRHSDLLHFADLLVMHLARIIFWFHPVVYIYHKRLLLVHEYQADNSAAAQPQTYGKFLIEQAMLHAAPSLTHSFNRSPIKNRILMLGRRSGHLSRTKILVLLPLVLVCTLCCSRNSKPAFEQKGNAFTLPGTTVEMTRQQTDTITIIDPVTGKEDTQIQTMSPRPLKMNGKKIQQPTIDDLGGMHPKTIEQSGDKFYNYLISNLKPLLEKLEDGKYFLGPLYPIVNEKGQLAYYELRSIHKSAVAFPGATMAQMNATQRIDEALKRSINEKTATLLRGVPDFGILNIDGTAMPYDLGGYSIEIKNHHLDNTETKE